MQAREVEDGSRAGIRPRGAPAQGHLHVLEDRAGAVGSRSKDGRERRMQCGTPRGDHISTQTGLQAPSIAAVMDGPEAAPIREMGGKPVPAEFVQDDHVIGL